MSFSQGPLGTNELTYSFNPNRSGTLAAYNNALALQLAHDRQLANGAVNAGAHGHVNEDVAAYYSRPADMSSIKNQRQKVITTNAKGPALQAVARTGVNPRYVR